jgi:hypothetical protein
MKRFFLAVLLAALSLALAQAQAPAQAPSQAAAQTPSQAAAQTPSQAVNPGDWMLAGSAPAAYAMETAGRATDPEGARFHCARSRTCRHRSSALRRRRYRRRP